AGKLKLDEPLTTYLPSFAFKNAHPDGPTITIRHLLTHTSGLPRELAEPLWNDPKALTRDEALRLLGQAESIFAAEREFKYSNLGFAILGEVVAAVSGEPYAQYVESHILKPLGMAATRVTPRADTPGLATAYTLRGPDNSRAPIEFVDLGWFGPAGGLASSVDDLAKFIALQFRDRAVGGPQILKGSTLREMRRPQWLRPDWQTGQGLGFALRRAEGILREGHGGFLPGQSTLISFAPASYACKAAGRQAGSRDSNLTRKDASRASSPETSTGRANNAPALTQRRRSWVRANAIVGRGRRRSRLRRGLDPTCPWRELGGWRPARAESRSCRRAGGRRRSGARPPRRRAPAP